MKYSTTIGASMDGFIAKGNGDVSWLEEVELDSDLGFFDYYNSTDVLIMGRNTYDVINKMDVPWPYQDKTTYVLTTRKIDKNKFIKVYKGDLAQLHKKLSKKYKHAFVVGGSDVIKRYNDLKMISEITISVVNVNIGSGIRLFYNKELKNQYKLVDTQNFKNAKVFKYERLKG